MKILKKIAQKLGLVEKEVYIIDDMNMFRKIALHEHISFIKSQIEQLALENKINPNNETLVLLNNTIDEHFKILIGFGNKEKKMYNYEIETRLNILDEEVMMIKDILRGLEIKVSELKSLLPIVEQKVEEKPATEKKVEPKAAPKKKAKVVVKK